MKTIAVMGIMEDIINSIRTEMEIISAKNIIGLDFVMGKMSGNNIILVKSGTGKVNASICAQILIDMYAADCIINIGAAGIFGGELKAGDIVISDDLCYINFNGESFEVQKEVVSDMDGSFFTADPELISFFSEAAEENGLKSFIGRIATEDEFINADFEKSEIKGRLKALCVDMEGGAVAHTCYLNKIPFVIVCAVFKKFSESGFKESGGFGNSYTDSFAKTVKKVIEMIE